MSNAAFTQFLEFEHAAYRICAPSWISSWSPVFAEPHDGRYQKDSALWPVGTTTCCESVSSRLFWLESPT